MKRLRINFDNPEHGWIGISVNDGINTVGIDANSKTGSFQQLVTALIGLTANRGKFRVTWFEEPVEREWTFVKQQSEIVFEFRRLLYTEPVFQFVGSYQEVCFPFWRALQSLKGRFAESELEERIEDEFPFSGLERLAQQIRAMKRELLI